MDCGFPMGGRFPKGMTECYFPELYTKNRHRSDTKQLMDANLMKTVTPQ